MVQMARMLALLASMVSMTQAQPIPIGGIPDCVRYPHLLQCTCAETLDQCKEESVACAMYLDHFQESMTEAAARVHTAHFGHPLLNTLEVKNRDIRIVPTMEQMDQLAADRQPAVPAAMTMQDAMGQPLLAANGQPILAPPPFPPVQQPYDDTRTAYDDRKAPLAAPPSPAQPSAYDDEPISTTLPASETLQWLRYQRLRGRTPPPANPPTKAPCTMRMQLEEQQCLTYVRSCQQTAARLKRNLGDLRQHAREAEGSPLSPPGIY